MHRDVRKKERDWKKVTERTIDSDYFQNSPGFKVSHEYTHSLTPDVAGVYIAC